MQRIISNKLQCKHCGEIIESKHVHDLVKCKCETCSVDGGHWHLSRSFRNSPEEDFIELSETKEIDDKEYRKMMQ